MIKSLEYSQGELLISTSGQDMYEITKDLNTWLNKEQINSGQLTLFIQHTSASICVQENASEDVISELLPVLDDFDRAIQNNQKVDDAETIKEGFNLIYIFYSFNIFLV